MSNWVGTSRTNYFHVKDAEKFLADMDGFDIRVVHMREGDECFAIIAETDNGEWPSYDFRTAGEDDYPPEAWFPEIVAEYLADNEVAVFQTVGAEKSRYVTGYAVAINNKGEVVQVTLDDIYEVAKEKFGVAPSLAQY